VLGVSQLNIDSTSVSNTMRKQGRGVVSKNAKFLIDGGSVFLLQICACRMAIPPRAKLDHFFRQSSRKKRNDQKKTRKQLKHFPQCAFSYNPKCKKCKFAIEFILRNCIIVESQIQQSTSVPTLA